jgi:hypothetical protein
MDPGNRMLGKAMLTAYLGTHRPAAIHLIKPTWYGENDVGICTVCGTIK